MTFQRVILPDVPGHLEICVIAPENWVIDRIFVEEDQRGKGYAKALLKGITEQADDVGAVIGARLLPDGEDRRGLVRLFERFGFKSHFDAGGIAMDVEREPHG